MRLSNNVDVVDEGDKSDGHSTQRLGPDDAFVHGRKASKDRTLSQKNKSLEFKKKKKLQRILYEGTRV